MPQKADRALKNASPYNAAITREQFLFYEMRITAKLYGVKKNYEIFRDVLAKIK